MAFLVKISSTFCFDFLNYILTHSQSQKTQLKPEQQIEHPLQQTGGQTKAMFKCQSNSQHRAMLFISLLQKQRLGHNSHSGSNIHYASIA
jgi:hypothetical protein